MTYQVWYTTAEHRQPAGEFESLAKARASLSRLYAKLSAQCTGATEHWEYSDAELWPGYQSDIDLGCFEIRDGEGHTVEQYTGADLSG